MASVAQTIGKPREFGFVTGFKNALLSAHSEDDLLGAAKRSRNPSQPRAGKLQPAPAEDNLRRRQHANLAIRQNPLNPRNRFFEALAHRSIVDGMYQPRRHVAAVRSRFPPARRDVHPAQTATSWQHAGSSSPFAPAPARKFPREQTSSALPPARSQPAPAGTHQARECQRSGPRRSKTAFLVG